MPEYTKAVRQTKAIRNERHEIQSRQYPLCARVCHGRSVGAAHLKNENIDLVPAKSVYSGERVSVQKAARSLRC